MAPLLVVALEWKLLAVAVAATAERDCANDNDDGRADGSDSQEGGS